MNLVTIFLASLAFCALVWYVVVTLLIYEFLRKRSEKVSFIWIRAMAPFYANRYKQITKKQTGQVGTLFYQWIISINLLLVFTVVTILIHYF